MDSLRFACPRARRRHAPDVLTFATNKNKLRHAERRDGHYLLRSNLSGEDPAVLWERYVQLTYIEAAFKTMKSELGLRRIYHQLGHRVEARILVTFLAYCLLPWLPCATVSIALCLPATQTRRCGEMADDLANTALVAEAIRLRVAALTDIVDSLSPEQKRPLLAEFDKPGADADLLNVMKKVFHEDGK